MGVVTDFQHPAETERTFLFLQGPHGPFFGMLADTLIARGANVYRVGFNAGDQFFWGRRVGYLPCEVGPQDWPDELRKIIHERRVTDIVLYGEARPIHLSALDISKELGLRSHIFEEGYLRPYWSTYERDGSNGNSQLVNLSVAQMTQSLKGAKEDQIAAPAQWGAMRQHVFYGALYHFFVLFLNHRYRRLPSHRDLSVGAEFRLYLKKLALMPWSWIRQKRKVADIFRGRFSFDLVLLQLAHDTSFIAHAPFRGQGEFIEHVIESFSSGAAPDQHLLFKAHPLEDGRLPIPSLIRDAARRHGVADRVHFLMGGKLSALLDRARAVVTVNSTAAQQALWRGLPLRAFGPSVYAKPEFVSKQDLPAFFQDPMGPDKAAYLDYRKFLLSTSQIPGSFYSAKGRRQLRDPVVAAMLAPRGPYAMVNP